jgi:hypothetical protein
VAENTNLLIGTPAHAGQVHADYVSALLMYQRERIPFTLMMIGNESLITRARNTIISAFFSRREFSHLLFLDGDVHLPHDGLARLLAHRKDVVAAPVALTGLSPDGGRLFNVGKTVGEDGPLLVVDRAGAAALLLSRAAADALVADARAEQRVYELSPLVQDAGIQYDVFRVGIVDAEYLSEDFWVCHVLRRLGFRIHVDPAVVTRHNGMVAL